MGRLLQRPATTTIMQYPMRLPHVRRAHLPLQLLLHQRQHRTAQVLGSLLVTFITNPFSTIVVVTVAVHQLLAFLPLEEEDS